MRRPSSVIQFASYRCSGKSFASFVIFIMSIAVDAGVMFVCRAEFALMTVKTETATRAITSAAMPKIVVWRMVFSPSVETLWSS
jgi:hypothetical protein